MYYRYWRDPAMEKLRSREAAAGDDRGARRAAERVAQAHPVRWAAAGAREASWRRLERCVELFDLAADPGESTNLASRRPRVVREMLRELLRVMGEVGDALPPEASALLKA